jgi:hypothetical protein
MPTAPDAAAFIAEAQAVSALTSGPVVNETFISCYRTDWWQPSPLTQADGFTSYPNGSAMTADRQFFHALTAAEGATLPTNPKSTFCFCAHRGVPCALTPNSRHTPKASSLELLSASHPTMAHAQMYPMPPRHARL